MDTVLRGDQILFCLIVTLSCLHWLQLAWSSDVKRKTEWSTWTL